ncbi:MAG: sulfurtransferase [Chloroflexi bacterium]|nr:MAG: sulfurtransferase [Chloroflexota bacterium]MBL1196843.1 sulfurtransferase [Chloroflexota bacterium]NOH14138.1 sulfurtransferase [Chloroflexota bacterium]
MKFETLISVNELQTQSGNKEWVIVDCRFSLDDTEYGRKAYLQAHIPGAVYAHLDEDLSGQIIPGKTSRHPLPSIDEFVDKLSNWGIDENVQVVVYDDLSGAYAARLWWMLRWLGHNAVAVLDGGWAAWQAAKFDTVSGEEGNQPRTFSPSLQDELAADADKVLGVLLDPNYVVVDSRGPERYRGDEEPIDPVAGHIPGAVNLPYAGNVNETGFKTPDELRGRFASLLEKHAAENLIFYCGSGVTAAHNALAVLHAGLGEAKIYPGSWSEWITDDSRPIKTGEEDA